MEIGKRNNPNRSELLVNDGDVASNVSIHKMRMKMIGSVAKNIFLNPVILMTILGIFGNFIFKHKVPIYLGGVLEVSRQCSLLLL